jgi:3-methyl-2-oxobutanoate hydroxymethyltransferase
MNSRVSVLDLQNMKSTNEKWSMITCYDALTAGIFETAGARVLLVGDSAAMVVFGHDSTLPITLEEITSLAGGVVRGSKSAMVIADLPFGTYQASVGSAVENAMALIKLSGAQAVKLEGGQHVLPQIEAIVAAGIPVVGHLGLTPQSVHAFGGYKVQGRGEKANFLLRDAKALEAAGVFALVLEAVPADLAGQVAKSLSIPVVGIGAGPEVDAQVLVWQDLLGLTAPPHPRFVEQYANLRTTISDSVSAWVNDVRAGVYPSARHAYE